MRKAIFWLHLLVGVVAGSVVLSMALSGMAIAWERQIIEYAERGFRVHAAAGSLHLPPETLLARAAAAQPDQGSVAKPKAALSRIRTA